MTDTPVSWVMLHVLTRMVKGKMVQLWGAERKALGLQADLRDKRVLG